MSVVRSVLGDRSPDALGVVDYHEHLFQVSPLLPGDELDDEARSGEEAGRLAGAGVGTMVEATPLGLGRQPEAVARIAADVGLTVVHTTGLHHGGHYPDAHPVRGIDEASLVALLISEVTEGMRPEGAEAAEGLHRTPAGEPIRAGIVKAAARYWAIDAFERRGLTAAATASRATGCAVMVHLDHGSAAHEVLDLLAADGVRAERVVLAHIDRNLDAGLHAELAARGAYLGYDGAARHREAPDSALIACLAEAVDRGAAERIVLGGDVARRTRYIAYGGLPGLDYLPRRFVPRLADRISPLALHAVTQANAARLLQLHVDEPLA